MAGSREEKPSKGGALKIGLIALGSVLAVVIGSYCALCAWVNGSDQILPHTAAAGVDVSGMTRSAAEAAIQADARSRRAGRSMELTVTRDGAREQIAVLNGEEVLPVDAAATAQAAWQRGRTQGFALAGWRWLEAHWAAPAAVDAQFSEADTQKLLEQLTQCTQQFNRRNAMVEPSWRAEREENGPVTALDFHLGQDGLAVDPYAACAQVTEALRRSDFSAVVLEPEQVPAPEADLEKIHEEIYVAPEDAVFDEETRSIRPHVTGVSFDIADVRARLKRAAEAGEQSLRVETELTEPEMTTEGLEATLFRDVLGTCTTRVGGSANRLSNVRLAASLCTGRVLLPGEQFSYNEATGPRTLEKGFLPAPSYVDGNTVDSVGGGICQVSSTIYLAALRSNLQIVQRQNHSFAVGYIPDGMDATVFYGAVEFIFANNTPYPIKLEATVEGRSLTVSVLGTNVDGIRTEITNRTLSTNPYQVVYEEDPSLKPGESREKVSGYTGRVVETYRNVYDKDGTLISSTLESTNYYKRRDRVVLVPPADTPTVQPSDPEPTPETPETPAPDPSPTPAPGPDTPVIPVPEPTPVPQPEPTPDATPEQTGEAI